jgi:hypothetical protein
MVARSNPHTDPTALFRREVKFLLRYPQDVDRARDLLEARAVPIRFGATDESCVSSIYFDDPVLSSCRETLAGVGRRAKLRARWYDQSLPRQFVCFEAKVRHGPNVCKHRQRIDLGAPAGDVSYDVMRRRFTDELSTDLAALLALRSEPSVLVSYRRRHYRHPSSEARFTLDYDIVGYDQGSIPEAPSRRFGVPLDTLALIEVKLPPDERDIVAPLLSPLNPRPTRLSKYVMCCARMGWCALPDHY